uniref:Transposase n=1 Tax=Haemonchus placei TaxID=6290 RepID=A0A0N4WHI1_HAEPC
LRIEIRFALINFPVIWEFFEFVRSECISQKSTNYRIIRFVIVS